MPRINCFISCFILFVVFASLSTHLQAQHNVSFKVINYDSNEPVIGATVSITNSTKGGVTDKNGLITLKDITSGSQSFTIRHIGFITDSITLDIPLTGTGPQIVYLHLDVDELDQLLVSSTRGSRTIENTPTRVEFIAGVELEEKGNMRPGDIRMLLNESTGIMTQQTSLVSGNASIRIQGLDGRYTQILKDGFPLYSGAASGLGLLQIPPLDLKQVEVIKGSSSTLYGGGAIAGMVNLISKTPDFERDIYLHFDANSGNGFDLNGFYSNRNKKIGTTIFASHNRNFGYDPTDIGKSAIPKFERYVFNPKLFYYINPRSTLSVGINATVEDRIGGKMDYIQNKVVQYSNDFFERNLTNRYSTQINYDYFSQNNHHFNFKNSISYFERDISTNLYKFSGDQVSTFTEASYTYNFKKTELITGLNLWTERFSENKTYSSILRDFQHSTMGFFIQNSTDLNNWIIFESGLRTDYVFDYEPVILPRLSFLFKFNDKLSSRIGSGFGYKTPTVFTEESERILYKNLLPIDKNENTLERSYGGNVDLNYTSVFWDKLSININQLLFYTHLKNPLLMSQNPGQYTYSLNNSSGHIDTKGIETNIKLGYSDFELYLGYTFTDTYLNENGNNQPALLTPKHRINAVLIYEIDDFLMIGLENYYYSEQRLSNGNKSKPYVLNGLMIEKLWEQFSLYINFENFRDIRQSRFEDIYYGSGTSYNSTDIYMPLDGFIINGGIKIRL